MSDHLTRPYKILILGEAAAIHTRRWVAYFRKRGWTVRWLSFPPIDAGEGAEEIASQSGRRAWAIWRSRTCVRRVIDSFTPDIISALFLPDYGWLGCLTGRHPLAVSAWGSDVLLAPNKSPLHRWRIRYVLGNADWLFCDAEIIAARMRELGADPAKIQIIPLGIEDTWFPPSPKHGDEATIHVVTNRRLEPLYRVDTFLGAAAQLVSESPQRFRFTVVGDGSLRTELETQARELGLGESLTFTGFLPEPDLQRLMHAADIFVSCSSSDGTSVSLLEAMAAGAFPIVTDLPANREWIQADENGILFPVGDIDALARAIQRSADDSVWRRRTREQNMTIVRGRALWQDNMAAAEETLITLIADSRAQSARGSIR